jgi:hypothetical protein
MILDAHPDVMCGPEAPWIAGRGSGKPPNLKDLTHFLVSDKWGPVSGFNGVTKDTVYQTVAAAIHRIMSAAAKEQSKTRWAEKTPENILAVPFLYRLFPDAKFVHIVRDGRDVAISTSQASWKRIAFEGQRIRNNYHNALRRWVAWITQFLRDAESLGLTFFTLRYEDLVLEPPDRLKDLLRFLDLPWSDRILDPHGSRHDIIDPKGEGVTSFYQRHDIDTNALYRWKTQLRARQKAMSLKIAEETLVRLGYGTTLDER